jgi:hypothetical protein
MEAPERKKIVAGHLSVPGKSEQRGAGDFVLGVRLRERRYGNKTSPLELSGLA